MDGWIARKRLSIYLVLFCWGVGVAEMEPGFHAIVAGTILLAMLTVLRLVAHVEGQYMLKAAEATHGQAMAHTVVFRHLLVEMLIGLAIFGTIGFAVGFAIHHWIYVPMVVH